MLRGYYDKQIKKQPPLSNGGTIACQVYSLNRKIIYAA